MEKKLIINLNKNIIGLIFEFLNEKQLFYLKSIKNKKIYKILLNQFLNKNLFVSKATYLRKKYTIIKNFKSIGQEKNKMTVFKDNKNNIILAFLNSCNHLEIYDFLLNKSIHTKTFDDLKSIFYYENNNDYQDLLILKTNEDIVYLLSISNNYEIVVSIKKNQFNVSSIVMFYHEYKDVYYIVISSLNEKIYVYDLSGNLKKSFKNYKLRNVIHSQIYHDQVKKNYYIVYMNEDYILILNFDDDSLYRILLGEISAIRSICLVYEELKEYNLVEASLNGYITFWDIDRNQIIGNLKIKFSNIVSLLIWNDEYLIASDLCAINIISLTKREILISIKCHKNLVVSLTKIIHPLMGEVLFTSGNDGKIKVWNTRIR